MANPQKTTTPSSPAEQQQQANGVSNPNAGAQSTPTEGTSSEDVPSFSPSSGSLYNNVDGNPVAGDAEEQARLGTERIQAFLASPPDNGILALPPQPKQNEKSE